MPLEHRRGGLNGKRFKSPEALRSAAVVDLCTGGYRTSNQGRDLSGTGTKADLLGCGGGRALETTERRVVSGRAATLGPVRNAPTGVVCVKRLACFMSLQRRTRLGQVLHQRFLVLDTFGAEPDSNAFALSTVRLLEVGYVAALSSTHWSDAMFQVLVVGASVGGLATAAQLQRRGVTNFQVIEATNRSARASASRAVGLWTNAWQVLDALGIAAALRQASPWNTTEFWVQDLPTADLTAHACLRRFALPRGHEFRRVPLQALTDALAASLPAEHLHYGMDMEQWLRQRAAVSEPASTPEMHRGREKLGLWESPAFPPDLFLVGADGARSVVRHRLVGDDRPLRDAGYVAHTGVAQLPLPGCNAEDPGNALGSVELTKPGRVLLLLGRGDGTRLGVQRINEHQVFWFYCENCGAASNQPANKSKELRMLRGSETKQRAWERVSRSVARPHGVLWNALEQLFRETPAEAANTFACADLFPPVYDGTLGFDDVPVALVGDAAHPITPNLSQGAGLALEDGWMLANLLADAYIRNGNRDEQQAEQRQEHWSARVRRKYRQRRRWRASVLALRSRATGAVLQLPLPSSTLVTIRNRILLPLALQPHWFVSHANFSARG